MPTTFTMPDTPEKLTVVHFSISAGGVKRHILEVADRHDRDMFNMIGVFPDEALSSSVAKDMDVRYRAEFARRGLPCYPMEIPRELSPWIDLKSIFALARLLRRLKPDILHCHSSKAGYIGRPAALLAGVRAVCYTPHTMLYLLQTGVKRQVCLWAEKLLAPLARAVIAVSPREGTEMEADLHLGARLVTITNGVRPYDGSYDLARVRREYDLPPEALVILSPTRCEPPKDVRTLILAMDRVRLEAPEAVLLVAGEGPLRGELEDLTDRLELRPRVRFLGWVDQLEPLMAASDIVALSSAREGLPYAVLEASAMGKPTVGTRVAGVKDCIRDGETGFLLTLGDSRGFAEKILDLGKDPAMRAAMGRAGQKMVAKDFSCDHMVRQMEILYARLVS